MAEKVAGLPPGHGLNAATGEYVDMLAAGVVDPAKVTRSALQNAASIAALFLTTEAVVADKPEKAAAGGGRWRAGHGRHGLLSPRLHALRTARRGGPGTGPPSASAVTRGRPGAAIVSTVPGQDPPTCS